MSKLSRRDIPGAFADVGPILDRGTGVFEGTPAALRADQQVTATYLGVGG